MAKRTKAATGRTGAGAAAHRHVEYVQADLGDIEPLRMDTAIAEAVFEVSVAEGIDDAAVIAAAVQAHVAAPEAELTPAEVRSRIDFLEQQLGRYKARLLTEINAADFADLPHFRVVGRVLHVLTHHRKYPSASGPDIFLVFLAEIPHQLEATHRQAPPGESPFNPTLRPGLSNIYTRLKRLIKRRYAATTSTNASGDEQGYVLTEDGALVFEDWPEIPGLAALPPPTTRRPPPRTATKRRRAASN